MKKIAAKEANTDSSAKPSAVRFNETVSSVPATTTTATGFEESWQNDYFGADGDGAAFGDEKNCGACTMLNPMSATVCSICNTPFS